MPSGSPNPTVSRLELAARLRELRVQAGKSIDDAAAELMCSVAKISRMETGGRGVQPRDIRDLCRLYGVSNGRVVRMISRKLGAVVTKRFRPLDVAGRPSFARVAANS